MTRKRKPKLRRHSTSNRAFIELDRRRYYLGDYDDPATRERFEQGWREYLKVGVWRTPGEEPKGEAGGVSIVRLIAAWDAFAAAKWPGENGKPGREHALYKAALKPVRQLYGLAPVSAFGPLALQVVRDAFIEQGWSRPVVNRAVGRIRRVFKWGVSRELVPAAVHMALQSVDGLRYGETKAPERPGVAPVEDHHVDKTLPHMPPIVADIVRLQRLTGARPGELLIMRPMDLVTGGTLWEYRPSTHKLKSRERDRLIYFGAQAQAIVAGYLRRATDAFCFSPREAEEQRRAAAHAQRQTPLSCGNRPGSNRVGNPKWQPGERYTVPTYRRAIHRACDAAGVPRWSPNRLRHAAATAIRRELGIEAAQALLGHAMLETSQIYAEKSDTLARRVAEQFG